MPGAPGKGYYHNLSPLVFPFHRKKLRIREVKNQEVGEADPNSFLHGTEPLSTLVVSIWAIMIPREHLAMSGVIF